MTELGTVLDGKYEILKKVGQGGMSYVFLAMDNRLSKQWAVKEIKNDGSKSTETLLKSLEREANILKNVDHPVLPRIVDILNEKGTIYVVMDFVEGRALNVELKENGAQPQQDVIEWGRALASALNYLHSMNPPIIYRDMKPANIMLKPDGTVKLIDFGTAKEYVVENIADTTALGTRGYAAPEQFGDAQGRGMYNTDARTDIYNLGATLYHLVTGMNPCDPPYEIKPIREWNPYLSSGLEQIITKCCQPNPEDRYQTCAELLYALDHYDELDNEHRSESKKKLAKFGISIGLSIASILCAVCGVSQKNKLKEQNYNAQITQAEEQLLDGNVDAAITTYKEAIALDEKNSDAYLGLLDAYAYYYEDADDAVETGAEAGVRYVTKYIDTVSDDVIYQVAIIYYNEVQDYKTAMKYFNMVDDSKNFADEVTQAGYYVAICENKIKATASFSSSKDSLYSFQDYNSANLSDTNVNKYVNYLNIASIYVDNLSSEDGLAERTVSLLTEANDNLDENATALSNAFPEDRGVKYYTAQYARILYSVYSYMAEVADDAKQQETYLVNAINALSRYLASIDISDETISESTKKSYVKYMACEAECYVRLAEATETSSYYDKAEAIYSEAEANVGTEDVAADIYVSHLDYLYDRYVAVYGTNPNEWKSDATNKIKTVYEAGCKISALSNRENNAWNSLIVNSVISSIIG